MKTLKPPLPPTIIYNFLANNILNIPCYLYKVTHVEVFEGSTSLDSLLLKETTKQELIYKNLPDDYLIQTQPVIELANSKLNWIPKVNLEEVLEKTINYFKQETF